MVTNPILPDDENTSFIELWESQEEKTKKWFNGSELKILNAIVHCKSNQKEISTEKVCLTEEQIVEIAKTKPSTVRENVESLFEKGLIKPHFIGKRGKDKPHFWFITPQGKDIFRSIWKCPEIKEVNYCVAVMARENKTSPEESFEVCIVKPKSLSVKENRRWILDGFSFPAMDKENLIAGDLGAAEKAVREQTGFEFEYISQITNASRALAKDLFDVEKNNIVRKPMVFYGLCHESDNARETIKDMHVVWCSFEELQGKIDSRSHRKIEKIDIDDFAVDIINIKDLWENLEGIFREAKSKS